MSAHGKLQEHRGDGRGEVIAVVAGGVEDVGASSLSDQQRRR